MGDKTGIEWTDATWNPIRGCSRVSEGCRNCYAEKVAARFSGEGQPYEGLVTIGEKGARWNGSTRVVTEHLADPLRWRRPRRVFVNSMSDLFHESVAFETVAAIFGVMAACPRLTFQVLTKRPKRAREFFEWMRTESEEPTSAAAHKALMLMSPAFDSRAWNALRWAGSHYRTHNYPRPCGPWPLPNVWLGVSVEDQRTADERIPVLLELPAALRFVSYEPALGPVDFGMSSATCDCCDRWPSRWVRLPQTVWSDCPGVNYAPRFSAPAGVHRARSNRHGALSIETRDGLLGIKPAEFHALPGLDWIIVGGESGPGARPFDVAWARSTIEQCRVAGTKCFVKQLGARPIAARHTIASLGGEVAEPLALRHTKGADPSEWPEDLRVREMPEVGS